MNDDKIALAEWVIAWAKSKGAQEVSVSIGEGKSSQITVRNKQTDTLIESIGAAMSIRLYVDGRYSSHSTNRMEKPELETFISEAVAATRYLAEDPHRKLPNPSLYFKGEELDLDNTDDNFNDISSKQKLTLAQALEDEIYGSDERIISIESNYSDVYEEALLMTSNGFKGVSKESSFDLYVSVSVKGDGDTRPSSGWHEGNAHFSKLKKSDIGKKALSKALSRIGQQQGKTGVFNMIVDPLVSKRLLAPMITAIYGSNIQQKNSFLIDMLDKKVASELFTLIDDPLLPGAPGSKLFDGEGLTTKKRTIFEQGTLKTYFINTYNASKLGIQATTGSPGNLILEPGIRDMEEMIAGLQKGYLITGFNGGNCNSSTGDFSYGVEGFIIEEGKLGAPVTEMNITGNMLELWSNLTEVGNDPRLNSSWRVPTLHFNNVNFSGKD